MRFTLFSLLIFPGLASGQEAPVDEALPAESDETLSSETEATDGAEALGQCSDGLLSKMARV